MKNTTQKFISCSIACLIALTMLLSLVACYQEVPTAAGPTPTLIRVPNSRPSATVVIDGSAIVGEITKNIALGFEAFTPGYKVQNNKSGTREGFKLFCDDKTDVQTAVRVISTDEAAACLRAGVDYQQIIIGYDALAIVGDAPIKGCISSTELTYIYTHDDLHWNKVRSSLPDAPVKVFAPLPEAAAAQFFVERIMPTQKGVRTGNIQDLIASGSGIGYLSLPIAQKLGSRLPIISVDSGRGCTAPSNETVWDSSYGFLSRPLYLYINKKSVQRGEVFRFLSYAFSIPGQQWVSESGFVPSPPSVYQEAQTIIDALH